MSPKFICTAEWSSRRFLLWGAGQRCSPQYGECTHAISVYLFAPVKAQARLFACTQKGVVEITGLSGNPPDLAS